MEFGKYTLRPYQVEDVQTLIKRGSGLNYLDMRLGKTMETLIANHKCKGNPCLIFVPKFALYVWEQEIRNILCNEAEENFNICVYTGTPKQRALKWEKFITNWGRYGVSQHAYFITNYAYTKELQALTDSVGIKWQGLICDEIHAAGLFNHKTNTYKHIYKLSKAIPHKWLLTGTPFTKGCVDFFGPLSILDRERFKSYWSFINRHCVTLDGPYGKAVERNPANAVLFRQMIHEYMIRRVKTEVYTEVPEKQRQSVPILMDKEQQRVYDELSNDLLSLTDGGELIVTPSVLALMIRQRQILICPQELGLKTRGVALSTIMEMSHEQVNNQEPFVIFTPFRKAVKWIEQALAEEYPQGVEVFKIQGKMTAEEFRDSWMGFQAHKWRGKPRVMIVVIKSGAGFSAWQASVGYFLGCEYNTDLNAQAEDRLWSADKQISNQLYYLLHKGTVEDRIMQILNEKAFSQDLLLSDAEYIKALLKRRI